MDQNRKIRLVEALEASKQKGNVPLAEAVRLALEESQSEHLPKAS